MGLSDTDVGHRQYLYAFQSLFCKHRKSAYASQHADPGFPDGLFASDKSFDDQLPTTVTIAYRPPPFWSLGVVSGGHGAVPLWQLRTVREIRRFTSEHFNSLPRTLGRRL